MRKLIRNVATVLRQPRVLWRYLGWCLARRSDGRPLVRIGESAYIGHFRSFSEFWSTSVWWSESEADAVRGRVGHDGAILDVGANVGVWTVYLARARPDMRVFAFEPSPRTFGILEANIRGNGATNAEANCVAVSSREGAARFLDADSGAATNRIVEEEVETGLLNRLVRDVRRMTLDQFAQDRAIGRIAFLKIDVEGHESEVLRGATGLLKARAINLGLIEVCPGNLRMAGSSSTEIYRLLEASGYEMMRADPRDAQSYESPLSLEEVSRIDLENVFFRAKGGAGDRTSAGSGAPKETENGG